MISEHYLTNNYFVGNKYGETFLLTCDLIHLPERLTWKDFDRNVTPIDSIYKEALHLTGVLINDYS